MQSTTTSKPIIDMDIIDLQALPGEYVRCTKTETETVFGVEVTGWTPIHRARMAVMRRWDGRCEHCGQGLRFAHILEDEDGFHCFGSRCYDVRSLGQAAADRRAYANKIEKKPKGYVFTKPVPPHYWDIQKDQRPAGARLWKTDPKRSRDGLAKWMLSVWGSTFNECLDTCMAIQSLLGNRRWF